MVLNRRTHHYSTVLIYGVSWLRATGALLLFLLLTPFLHAQYQLDLNGPYDPVYYDPINVPMAPNELSSALPIGFNFTFFENTYSQFYVSSNGFVTFSAGSGSGLTPQQLPDPNLPNNLIAMGWANMAADEVYLYYETIGTAPTRSLHINLEIDKFGYSGCLDGYSLYSQLILHETTNIIELHTEYWNGSDCTIPATQGIENIDGSVAFTVPGRNLQPWNSEEEYAAFIPGEQLNLVVTSYEPTLCTGNQDIQILVQNQGLDIIDSMYFDWMWEGVSQDAVFLEYTLDPDEYLQVTLGQKTIVAGEEYDLEAWSSNPDNGIDLFPLNDTIRGIVQPGLTGVKTIGGASPDYATITAAVADLMLHGVCDSVIFNIRNGTYNENLDINHFNSSGAGIVVFQSESGNAANVIITKAYNVTGTNRLIEIENNSHLRFKNLTCKVTGTACSNAFYITSYCTDIKITNCTLLGSPCTSTSSTGATIAMATGTKQQVSIKDNIIRKGNYGIYSLVGNPSFNEDMLISGNDIDSCYKYGVYLNRVDGLQMHHNEIFCPQSSAVGSEMSALYGDIDVHQNSIKVLTGLYGLRVIDYNSAGGTDSMKILNNMIHLGGGVSNSRSLQLDASEGVYIWHNTLNTINTVSTGLALFIGSSSAIDLKNNIVTNFGIGKAASFFGMTSDYNVFQCVTPPLLTSGSNYNTLADWQLASGQDAHSYQLNPQYVTADNLHILNNNINGTGLILSPPVTTDFDGETRSVSHSDIGADEIGFLNNDIGCTALRFPNQLVEGVNSIETVVSNLGINTVNSYTIQWKLNNVAQTPIPGLMMLLPGQKDTIVLGSVNMIPGQSYLVEAFTTMPNGQPDMNALNDTIEAGPLYPVMNGIYTVGGLTPDFANITSALNAVSLGGVVDSVGLEIREGLYAEAIELTATASFKCSEPVHIYSETGNASDVIINNNNLIKPTVRLSNVSGLRISNITFQLTNSAFNNVVIVENGASCNTFEGCIFNGRITTQTTTAYATVLCNTTQGVDNDFFNCHFTRGSYCLYSNGPSSATDADVDIINCHFKDAYYGGMYILNSDEAVVSGNIDTVAIAHHASRGGLIVNGCKNLLFSHNRAFDLLQGQTGISISECDGQSGDTTFIFNNYAYTNSVQSFGVGYSNNTVVANNTVRNLNGAAAGFSWSSNFKVENNIFESLQNGPAIEFLNMQGTNNISRHNCFHTPNADVGELANVRYHTLEQWQATGFDATSFIADPYFDGISHHVHQVYLDEQATPHYLITDDLDGDTRHATTPDIGADEFTPEPLDAGLLAILHPAMPFPIGENTVYVKFNNNGSETLSSLQFNWSINDTLQTPFVWTGLLPYAEEYDSLEIGSYSFTPFTTYDLRVWITQPNGQPDGYVLNDTLESNNLVPGLAGIYTIGGDEPDFETITAAVAALHAGGASADVTFNIRNGVYAQPFALVDFPGSECYRNVLFQSESGEAENVTITNLGINAHTVVLNGADGVEFKNLTIVSVNTAWRHAVQFSNGSHCNKFTDNIIKGFQSTATAITSAVIRSLVGIDTANVFSGNYIQYGAYGFHLTGTVNIWTGVTIENNTFANQQFRAIYAIRQDGIIIKGNSITLTGASTSLGFELYECHRMREIAYNKIISFAANYGILVDNCDQVTTSHGKIFNNMISIGGTGVARGLQITGSAFVDVIHNSINTYSTTTTLDHTPPIYVSSNPSMRILNNVFRNAGVGYAIYANSNTPFIANNNDYHTTGATFGYWNGGAVETTFTLWKTASGQDANSLNVNPAFFSNTDLHTYLALLNAVGQSGTGVPDDIDGEARNTLPDMGADEFDPLPLNDAGIFMYAGPSVPFAHGTKNVNLVLKNFGGNALSNVLVRWTVNGIEQTPFAWTGPLPSTQCDTFTVGTFLFEELLSYQINAWTEMPNGSEDAEPANDLLSTQPFYASLSGVYTVGGFAPDFNVVADLETILREAGIVGNVTFNFRPGIYTEAISINKFPRINYAHSVTFQSESGDSTDVILTQNTNSTVLVDLDNAHRITFKKLTLRNTKGHVCQIRNASSIISIENNRLEGLETVSSSRSLIYSATTTEDSITILNNLLQHGYYGVYLYGAAFEKRHIIQGNTFQGNFYYCAYLRAFDGLTLTGNFFNATSTSNKDLYMYNGIGACTITKNKIISDESSNAVLISTITNTSPNASQFVNNYVYKSGNTSADVVQIDNVSKINIDFNSINSAITNSSSDALYTENLTTWNVRDNIFYSITGPAFHNSGTLPTVHNYNDIYSLGLVQAVQNTIPYNTLASYVSATSTNTNSKAIDPLFATPQEPQITHYQLNSAGLAIAGITTDIAGTTRSSPPDIGAKEFSPLMHDVKLSHIQHPADGCGLTDDETVTAVLVNQGSNNATGFNIHYTFGGDTITENIGSQVVVAGDTLFYQFTQSVDASAFDTYSIDSWHSYAADLNHANDSTEHSFTNHPPFTSPVANMIPVDGSTNLENTVSLSWSPVDGAVTYDLYLWLSNTTKPLTPTYATLSTITKLVSNLAYGSTYLWQIHARNICNEQLLSATSSFTTRVLPDLLVQSMIIPATGYSEQTIGIEWITTNTGGGLTVPGTWYDNIYLSTDPTYNSFDPLLGSIPNLTSLPAGQSYTHNANVVLPQGSNGNYYIIIKTDHNNGVKETNNNNNTTYSATLIQITLSPAPDLIVTDVTTPLLTFSGQTVNISYEVRNNGDGITTNNIWKDEIWLIPVNSGSNTILTTRTHVGHLQPDSSYTANLQVGIPANIFGDYQIRVFTDYKNDVFEFASEGNNQTSSDVFEIVLTPPVDLVPDSIVIGDTFSLYQSYFATYEVRNDGGSSPVIGWTDRYYLSQSPVYNTNFLTHIGSAYHNAGLMPADTTEKRISLYLNGDYSGVYYLYILADYNNKINEYAFENNNIIRSAPFVIIKPDLKPDSLIHTANAMSGSPISLRSEIINKGPGEYIGNQYARYYLSADNQLSTATDFLLSSNSISVNTLAGGDTVSSTFNFYLPVDQFGAKYIICHADATQVVFEGNENNNILASPIQLFESPHADLFTSSIQTPDTITAGVAFDLSYMLSNIGDRAVTKAATDSIFLSFSPSWNRLTATPLGVRVTSLLDTSQVVSISLALQSLISQNPNQYYIYIVSDAKAAIYEGSGETNNIHRSDLIVLLAYPEVDIRLHSISSVGDTLMSGQQLPVSYTVQNLSPTSTYYNSWTEKWFLSVDSIYTPATDMLIQSFAYSAGKVAANNSQQAQATLSVPHGISGDYYLFIETDVLDLNNDPARSNNANTVRSLGLAKKIHIKLALYPDLTTTDFICPTEVSSGQYFTIIAQVTNEGDGPARSRTDKLFVSENNTIESGDLALSTKSKGVLQAGQTQMDTMNVFVPANYTGNYFILFAIDYGNVVYEYQSENNNLLITSIIATPPPPADLVVKNVLVPDSVLAGHTDSITWQTENKGSNPAYGQFREIIYLSSDTTWSLTDEVLGIWDGSIYMSPGAINTKTIALPYNNVTNADYHTLIRTDAKNNIPESNESNNDGYSYDLTNVDIEEIFLDHPLDIDLPANTNRYYKLLVNAEEAGSNVLVSLTGDSLSGVNQLYIKYGTVPTEADHDLAFDKPFNPDQQLVIRDANPGYYYIMIKGFKVGSASPQPVTLLARLIRMEILDVRPRQGGNTGYTTIEIIGSELDSIVIVKLVFDDTDSTMYHEIVADTFIMLDNGARVMARFNLEGQPLGHYNILCHRESIWMASYERGFEIIEGSGPNLQVHWDFSPKSYNPRFNTVFQMKIDIENIGDNDAEERYVRVNTPNYDNPVYYSLNDYYGGIQHFQLLLPSEDEGGFAGVLKPGGRRTYYVYGRVGGTQGFSIFYDK